MYGGQIGGLMTKEAYLKFHRECCDRMVEITAKKNADYTGGYPCPFGNFTEVERTGTCETEVGFLVRMSDKFSRIRSFVKIGTLKVKDETVEDTLLDLANYCVLMAGYIRSKKDQNKNRKG